MTTAMEAMMRRIPDWIEKATESEKDAVVTFYQHLLLDNCENYT